ncbi:hypothetical protein HMPREF3224_02075 [Anaerococcus hydrogenalis]|nr:hypothetical protein HMPREF3224_02075 [Anaerococcus hydrogenalis]
MTNDYNLINGYKTPCPRCINKNSFPSCSGYFMIRVFLYILICYNEIRS